MPRPSWRGASRERKRRGPGPRNATRPGLPERGAHREVLQRDAERTAPARRINARHRATGVGLPSLRRRRPGGGRSLLHVGLSIIPIYPRSKRPRIAWRPYQERHATAAEVREWFERWPGARLAIVTGAISRVVVIDVDDPAERSWAEARFGVSPLVARTPRGGCHLYLRHPGGHVHNATKIDGHAVDRRADGGYVLCPPSDGYEWERPE